MPSWFRTKWMTGLAMTLFALVAIVGPARAGSALDENRVTLILVDSTG